MILLPEFNHPMGLPQVQLLISNIWCMFEDCLVALRWKTVDRMWDWPSILCGNCCHCIRCYDHCSIDIQQLE